MPLGVDNCDGCGNCVKRVLLPRAVSVAWVNMLGLLGSQLGSKAAEQVSFNAADKAMLAPWMISRLAERFTSSL
jgi:hypothetical protein